MWQKNGKRWTLSRSNDVICDFSNKEVFVMVMRSRSNVSKKSLNSEYEPHTLFYVLKVDHLLCLSKVWMLCHFSCHCFQVCFNVISEDSTHTQKQRRNVIRHKAHTELLNQSSIRDCTHTHNNSLCPAAFVCVDRGYKRSSVLTQD